MQNTARRAERSEAPRLGCRAASLPCGCHITEWRHPENGRAVGAGRAIPGDGVHLRAATSAARAWAWGGVWHVKQRAPTLLPVGPLDVEAGWGRPGRPGWVEGWTLHLASAVRGGFRPLAACLTEA